MRPARFTARLRIGPLELISDRGQPFDVLWRGELRFLLVAYQGNAPVEVVRARMAEHGNHGWAPAPGWSFGWRRGHVEACIAGRGLAAELLDTPSD